MKAFPSAVLTSALAATLVLGGALAQEPRKTEHPDAAMTGHSAGSMELHRIMTKGQEMPMPMSGDVDKDFAAMMTLHHR